MPGYFDDGTVRLELGEHVFATPQAGRTNLLLPGPGAAGRPLDSGGGILGLTVTGQRLRADLGDAERYLVEVLAALAASGAGTLGVEDENGERATFGNAVCVGGEGRVQAQRLAELHLDFLAPEADLAPAWSDPPDAPAACAGTSTAQDYAAGGVLLGTHPIAMRIEMVRDVGLRPIPRARGARPGAAARNARLHFHVLSHALVAGSNLAGYLADLAAEIGPRHVDLAGNGNTYADVLLQELRPTHTDRHHCEFEAEFVRQVAEATEQASTTTIAPTGTTTVGPGCPSAVHCVGTCATVYYCADFAGINCGSGVPCSGTLQWTRHVSGCTWNLSGSAGPCTAGNLTCAGGNWQFTMTHAAGGKTCAYTKAASAESCPAGVYARTGGNCPDCPASATVYS